MPQQRKPKDQAQVLVTISPDKVERLHSIAGKLRKRGLKVAETFELGGVIAGEVAKKDIAALRDVEGVEAVEIDSPLHTQDS